MATKILLVDDEEGIRTVLGITLADSGYEVLTAASGEEALALLRRHTPEVVLTDIKMPGMDGLALLQAIKCESPDTEVIMITGHGDMDLAVRSLQLRAADFVTKPIHHEILEIAIRRALERLAMRRQLRDYTENLERLVAQRTASLVQAERLAAIGRTVAGLAHAIKNITGGLRGGMYVLDKGIALDNRTYLENGWAMVKRNVDKIGQLAMDLLHYARDRSLQVTVCDPNRILADIRQLMEQRAGEYGVELELEPAAAGAQLHCDPDAVHEALLNLVTNAIDACIDLECPNQPARVVMRARSLSDGAFQFEVEDNGCGMDEATRGRLFNDFFTTKGSQGTGLGLMISKKIVADHGGTLTVASAKGRGSTFTVTLPAQPATPPAAGTEPRQPPEQR